MSERYTLERSRELLRDWWLSAPEGIPESWSLHMWEGFILDNFAEDGHSPEALRWFLDAYITKPEWREAALVAVAKRRMGVG